MSPTLRALDLCEACYGLVYLRAPITVLKADLPEALNSVTEKVSYSKRINSPNIGRGSSWYELNSQDN